MLSTISLHAEVFSLEQYKKRYNEKSVSTECMTKANELADYYGLLENKQVKLWGINTDKVTEVYDI